MNVGTKRVVIELAYRGIVPVADPLGTRITCLDGRLWITEHRSNDDVVLVAGQWFEFARPGVAVVQALSGARFALEERLGERPGRTAVRPSRGRASSRILSSLEPGLQQA
jgi:hypothetical protein